MKKITFLMFTVLITVFSAMAQNHAIKALPTATETSQEKSGWVGNSGIGSLDILAPGYEYAIRVTAGELAEGSEVTTVKFYSDATNYAQYGMTGNEYNINIYEGGSFDEVTEQVDLASSGTLVYTEAYTATADGMQEVTLATAYTVGASEFWIAIENASATTSAAMFMGDYDDNTAFDYLMVNDVEGTDMWTSVYYCVDQECTAEAYFPLTLSFYYDDGSAYVENSDLTVAGYIDNAVDQNWITTLELQPADSLILYPVFGNNGPDDAADSMLITIFVQEVEVNSFTVVPETDITGGVFASGAMIFYPTPLMSGADMDALSLDDFDVCFSIEYYGNDEVSTNNEACISINRVLTGTNDFALTQLEIYPNPTADFVVIENAAHNTISIFNLVGQKILTQNISSNHELIDLSALIEGTYVIRIENGSEVNTQKLNVIR